MAELVEEFDVIKVNQANYDLAQALVADGRFVVNTASGRVLRSDGNPAPNNLTPSGYRQLRFRHEGRTVGVLEHRVVWESANGPIPAGLYINHVDGEKLNNRLINLELVTHQANMAHAHQTGLMDPVINAKRSPVDPALVRAIFRDAHSDMTAREVAAKHGVRVSYVRNIKLRRRCRRMTDDLALALRPLGSS